MNADAHPASPSVPDAGAAHASAAQGSAADRPAAISIDARAPRPLSLIHI